jgi:hypothetical protein
MTKLRLLALFAIFQAALVTPVLGANRNLRPAEAKAPELRSSLPNARARRTVLVRQDLFDRANPINFRSDWPAPPAQPGQF